MLIMSSFIPNVASLSASSLKWLCQICLPLSNQSPYPYNPYHHSSPKFPSSKPKALKHQSKENYNNPNKEILLPLLSLTKRRLNSSALALILNGFLPHNSKALSDKELELERYTDVDEGFTLLRPSSWIKVPFFFLSFM